jgi:hypothetical protein
MAWVFRWKVPNGKLGSDGKNGRYGGIRGRVVDEVDFVDAVIERAGCVEFRDGKDGKDLSTGRRWGDSVSSTSTERAVPANIRV